MIGWQCRCGSVGAWQYVSVKQGAAKGVSVSGSSPLYLKQGSGLRAWQCEGVSCMTGSDNVGSMCASVCQCARVEQGGAAQVGPKCRCGSVTL